MQTKSGLPAESLIFSFGPGTVPWPNIDDPVMGGRSRSLMKVGDQTAIFAGTVSLENNGGFASLRSPTGVYDLGGYDGLRLRVLGDGKTYKVRLRTDSGFDGVSYQASVRTEDSRWVELQIPFERFAPVYRGRTVHGHPALDPANIRTFGLLISDKQDGPFRLEIAWIKAYRNDPSN